MDPFFSECRAYGRLIEKNVNGKVAVRCHDYLMIPADREDEPKERFGVTTWNRPNEEDFMPASRREPLAAIVKDLVTEDLPLTVKTAKKMLFDMRRMRKYGVHNMDIAPCNYKGRRLVDFGFAMTTPHYLFVIKPAWRREMYKSEDLISFDKMLDEAGIVTLNRATPDRERVRTLRLRDNKGRVMKQN